MVFGGGSGFLEVTDFGLGGAALTFVDKAHLHGGISVRFSVLDLGHFVLTDVHNGDGNGFAFVVVDVGHTQLFA